MNDEHEPEARRAAQPSQAPGASAISTLLVGLASAAVSISSTAWFSGSASRPTWQMR